MITFRSIFESVDLPTHLYHGTSSIHVDKIMKSGVKPRKGWGGSYWGTEPIARHFAQMHANEHGGDPVVLRVPSSSFNSDHFHADHNIMDFPIPHHEKDHENRLNRLGNQQDPSWQDSLKHFDAVKYSKIMKVKKDNIV